MIIIRALVLTGLILIPPQNSPSAEVPPRLVDLFERYCLDPDGQHDLTWALARHDNYTAFDRSDFPGLRTPGARQVRGFTTSVSGTEIRVLTAVNRFALGPQRTGPATNFHLCWVSARPASRAQIDSELRTYLGVRRYRQEGAFAYPWVTTADDERKSVKRSDFTEDFARMAREEGMRVVTTNEAHGWVSLGYLRPIESCEDWCY